ncbi:hypothetical protein B296_00040818, partial [Ensete ventricosum]
HVGRRGVTSFLRGKRRRRPVSGETRRRLIPVRGEEASSCPARGRWRRLVPQGETPFSTVPPDSGQSAYRYPIGPVCTTHTGRYSLKWKMAVPPTIWYRLVAGLNAQLRLVRRGHLKVTFMPVLSWLETHANPSLRQHGICIDLAWFQATTLGYCQLGLVVYAVQGESETYAIDGGCRTLKVNQILR